MSKSDDAKALSNTDTGTDDIQFLDRNLGKLFVGSWAMSFVLEMASSWLEWQNFHHLSLVFEVVARLLWIFGQILAFIGFVQRSRDRERRRRRARQS